MKIVTCPRVKKVVRVKELYDTQPVNLLLHLLHPLMVFKGINNTNRKIFKFVMINTL